MIFFIVLFALILSTFFHLFGSIFSCLLTGIKIESVQIFYGKSIFKFNTRILHFELGYLPIGGSLKYDYEDFNSRNLFTRLFIVISGPISIFFGSAIFLTLQTSFLELSKGFEQILLGFLFPISEGAKQVQLFREYSKNIYVFHSVAFLLTKIAAFNLFPIPSLNGGQFIMEFFHLNNIKWRIFIFNIGFLLVLILMSVWLIAVIYSL